MKNLFKRFMQDTVGATAIEYALIASLISVAIVTTVTVSGSKVSSTMGVVNTKLR